MSITASLFVSVLIILFMIYIIKLIHKRTLIVKYSLIWFCLSFFILIVTWFPKILDVISNILGIYSPTNMVFFFGFCLSLIVIFYLTNIVSIQTIKIRKLTQKISLLEKEIEKDKND